MNYELKQPRWLRNNNPLNIRRSGDKWQGLRVLQEDREFSQFSEMKWGWRAAFRLLCHTYYGKYKLRTIRAIITRRAPPKENNTEAYIRRVTDRIGIGPDRELGDPQTHPTQWMPQPSHPKRIPIMFFANGATFRPSSERRMQLRAWFPTGG